MSSLTVNQRRLKAATKELAQAVGGYEVAAADVGKGHSSVGRWSDVHDLKYFINVADVATLEARSPRPLVTEQLCRIAGGVFVPLVQAVGDGEALACKVMQLAAELGQLSGKVSAGLADGEFSAADALAALGELADVEAVTASLRVALEVISGERD